jgi:hypothetical protein
VLPDFVSVPWPNVQLPEIVSFRNVMYLLLNNIAGITMLF